MYLLTTERKKPSARWDQLRLLFVAIDSIASVDVLYRRCVGVCVSIFSKDISWHVSLYVYPYLFCLYLLHVFCIYYMPRKISRWCPSCLYFISGQKLPPSGNAGLVLSVEYTQRTDNINEMKKASAKQGEAFLFPCKVHTLLLMPCSQLQKPQPDSLECRQ